MMGDTIFIYAKEGKITALNIEEAKKRNDQLLKDGYIHTQTLDICCWLQYIHNDCEEVDLLEEIKTLTKRLK
jgi:hypothetical protein